MLGGRCQILRYLFFWEKCQSLSVKVNSVKAGCAGKKEKNIGVFCLLKSCCNNFYLIILVSEIYNYNSRQSTSIYDREDSINYETL